MISLDQIQLLEAKIESAVEKIQQLQVENDALRNKCSELSNALSAKSEQLSLCEKDQTMIENGILKALNRLNSIENSVLKGSSNEMQSVIEPSVQTAETFVQNESVAEVSEPEVDSFVQIEEPVSEEIPSNNTLENQSFDTDFSAMPDAPVSDVPGFDIF